MGAGGKCRCVGIDVSLVRVIAPHRSLRKLYTLILVGLLLSDCFVSYVLHFSYFILCFAFCEKFEAHL